MESPHAMTASQLVERVCEKKRIAPAPALIELAKMITKASSELAALSQEFHHKLASAICGGTDDSVEVEQFNGPSPTPALVLACAMPVAEIRWVDDLATRFSGSGERPGAVNGLSWGTGILIAENLMLTAGHLFDRVGSVDRPSRNNVPIEEKEIATLMRARFNFQTDSTGALRTPTSFPITELVEFSHVANFIDYALVALGKNEAGESPAAAGVATLLAVSGLSVGTDLMCIQHRCSSTHGTCDHVGTPKRIAFGKLVKEAGPFIDHLIDTEPGSSGAPVFDAQGRTVAIQIQGLCEAGPGFNSALKISQIAAHSNRVRALVS